MEPPILIKTTLKCISVYFRHAKSSKGILNNMPATSLSGSGLEVNIGKVFLAIILL